jgi:hypothetical protein
VVSVRAGRTLHIAGQVTLDRTGTTVGVGSTLVLDAVIELARIR